MYDRFNTPHSSVTSKICFQLTKRTWVHIKLQTSAGIVLVCKFRFRIIFCHFYYNCASRIAILVLELVLL